MLSRFTALERKTFLVQFIAVEPLTFHTTSDGTDLVQDILRSQLSRSDADIYGQEGSLSIDEQGEFLTFEPKDTNNRILHLPIEHLAYCAALRRMRHSSPDQRDSDQIHRREFENVDLANRYAQYIIGPPIFVSVFHGFDAALCYTFITQSADDACLLVMKLMRAFKLHEEQIGKQGQINQGYFSFPSFSRNSGSPSSFDIKQGSPLLQSVQPFFTDNRQTLSSPTIHRISDTSINPRAPDPQQDEVIQRLLEDPTLQIVNQPTPFISQRVNDIPIISVPSFMNQPSSPIIFNTNTSPSSNIPLMTGSISQSTQPPSPPILDIPNRQGAPIVPMSNADPQVIFKPNNQEVVYKQNIMVRWLQPPTPPPPAPIVIREVQPPPETQPPIICRQMPPCPKTPPPIIIREKPPPCPSPGQPLIIEKRIPPVTLPRQVIIERHPAPPPKPSTVIYEKYLPQIPQQRQVIVKREICQPTGYPVVQQQVPGGRLVREVVRQMPQTSAVQPALVCVPQQQQICQPQTVQQLVPVFATQQHVVQPKGVRVVRQVVGPSTTVIQQPQQVCSTIGGSPVIQTVPATHLQ